MSVLEAFTADVKLPCDCTPDELAAFVQTARAGGEIVAVGLDERVRQAHLLCFMRKGGELAAVGGLKYPSVNHRAEVALPT